MLITIRVHDCRVIVKNENPGPHLMAIGYMSSGQELIRGKILAGHSPSVQNEAVADIKEWLRKNRPGWHIETLPCEGVIGCPGNDGCPAPVGVVP